MESGDEVPALLACRVGLESFETDGTVCIILCVLYFYNMVSVTDELKTS